MALPRNQEPVKTLRQLSEVVGKERPKTLEAMAQKLWHLDIPHRIVQLPESWLNNDNQIEAGLFLAEDSREPGKWWFVRITATEQRIQPLGKSKQAANSNSELTTRVLSLWPSLPMVANQEWRQLINYLDLKTAIRRAVPAASIKALLGMLLISLLGLVLAGQLDNSIAIAAAGLVLLLSVILDNQWDRYWLNRSDYHRRALGINTMMRLLRLPLSNLRSLGSLPAATTNINMQELGQKVPGCFSQLLPAISIFALSSAWLLLMQPNLGALNLLCCLIWLTTTVAIKLNTSQLKLRQTQHQGVSQQRSQELLEINEGLRLAGAEARALSWWKEPALAASKLQLRLDTQEFFITVVSLGSVATVLWAALQLPEQNGRLIALAISGLQLASMQKIATQLGQLQQLKSTWRIISTAFKHPKAEIQRTQDPGVIAGNISMRNVSFRYQSNKAPTINNISIDISKGSFVGIVGPSASGKSTLLRLLLGFEDAQQGDILFDGRNVQILDEHLLRSQIGVVLQNPQLVGSTLKDVITAGRSLSMAEAWTAVELAGLGEEIRALPMGLQTPVTPGARNFSGGQQQRLAIARALAGHPRLLILDEPTSALDNNTQRHVLTSLQGLGITCIMVAHRLSTVQQADVILVMRNGVLHQQGTYEDLSQQSGLFRDLMERQVL